MQFLNSFFDKKPKAFINPYTYTNKGKPIYDKSFVYNYNHINITTYMDYSKFFQRYKTNSVTPQYRQRYLRKIAKCLERLHWNLEMLFSFKNLNRFDCVNINVDMPPKPPYVQIELNKTISDRITISILQSIYMDLSLALCFEGYMQSAIPYSKKMSEKIIKGYIDLEAKNILTTEKTLSDEFLKEIGFKHYLTDKEAKNLIIENEVGNFTEFIVVNSIPRRQKKWAISKVS